MRILHYPTPLLRTVALSAVLLAFTGRAQVLTPELVTPLATTLNETSGLVMIDGGWWTHLDSGNPNVLYQIDPASGEISRQVTVENSSNTDWEDMTADEQWLYIGDVGNNSGARTDLRIFRIPIYDLLEPTTTSVTADTIRFAYADQTDFTPAGQNTIWDCEAMIAKDDSLFLFTKRWTDQRTVLYALPAAPGDHLAARRDSLDVQGLITGATIHSESGSIALLGYSNGLFVPFVWELGGYSGNTFFSGSAQRRSLSLAFVQTEGIAWSDPSVVLITNEESPLSPARLWQLPLGLTTATAERGASRPLIHPVPTTSTLNIPGLVAGTTLRLLDLNGREVRSVEADGQGMIDLQFPTPGVYVLEWLERGIRTTAQVVIIDL